MWYFVLGFCGLGFLCGFFCSCVCMVIWGFLLVFMVWGRVFGVVLRLCVLLVCVGLVGCRLSDPGSVDELRLLEVSQGAGDRGQGTGDRGQGRKFN